MANTTDQNQTKGVLVRGADGSLYFIPDEKLQAFKVPEKGVSAVASQIPHGAVAAHTAVSTQWMQAMPACIIQSSH